MSEILEISEPNIGLNKVNEVPHYASCEEFRNALTQKQINAIVDAWYRFVVVELKGGVIDE